MSKVQVSKDRLALVQRGAECGEQFRCESDGLASGANDAMVAKKIRRTGSVSQAKGGSTLYTDVTRCCADADTRLRVLEGHRKAFSDRQCDGDLVSIWAGGKQCAIKIMAATRT